MSTGYVVKIGTDSIQNPCRKVLIMMIVEFNILLMQIKIQIKSAHEFAHCGTCFACHVT